MSGAAERDWVSDDDSFFAHLSRAAWYSSRGTICGITLGKYNCNRIDLINAAIGKPKCSACIERVEVRN